MTGTIDPNGGAPRSLLNHHDTPRHGGVCGVAFSMQSAAAALIVLYGIVLYGGIKTMIAARDRFGFLLAQGLTPKEAEEKIEMVVEGVYTCMSALQISQQLGIPMPITEIIYKIIYEKMRPLDAVQALMQRTIKEEHL